MKDKVSLRNHFIKLLKEQSPEERLRKSSLIAGTVWKLPAFRKARIILFYVSLPDEVDTSSLINKAILSGKRVVLPVIEKNQRQLIPVAVSSMEDVHRGPYGIFEPRYSPDKTIALQDLDAVIVPGLAFDRQNNRLGRGLGYYDRFLSTLPKAVVTIGLAFDFQLTDNLPREEHDMLLQEIIAG